MDAKILAKSLEMAVDAAFFLSVDELEAICGEYRVYDQFDCDSRLHEFYSEGNYQSVGLRHITALAFASGDIESITDACQNAHDQAVKAEHRNVMRGRPEYFRFLIRSMQKIVQ